MTEYTQAIFGIVLYAAVLALYFLPGLVASTRNAKNQVGIWLLTLFLGWTFFAWVGALIWAVCDKQLPRQKEVIEYEDDTEEFFDEK